MSMLGPPSELYTVMLYQVVQYLRGKRCFMGIEYEYSWDYEVCYVVNLSSSSGKLADKLRAKQELIR